MSVNEMDNCPEKKNVLLKDFRVKIDLSKFNDGSKKLCYVYIDKNKIEKVSDLIKRIETLFSVGDEDFYLMIGDAFLPVDEDIRVVNPEEIITVVSGSAEYKLNFKMEKKSEEKIVSEFLSSSFNHEPANSIQLKNIPQSPSMFEKKIFPQDLYFPLAIDCDLKLNVNSITVRFRNETSTKMVSFVFDLIPQIDKNLIVGNTYQNGAWGSGKGLGGFMVDNCSSIRIIISCEEKGFRSFIEKEQVFFYPYPFSFKNLTHFVVFKN